MSDYPDNLILYKKLNLRLIKLFKKFKNNKMQNQRLLYSQSKRPRPGSINKENNIKLFNDCLVIDSQELNKKNSPQLRFDYDNNTRIQNRNNKTVSEEVAFSKPLERSPLRKNIDYNNDPPRASQNISSHSLHQYEPPRKNSFISSQQQIQSYTNKLLQNNQLYQDEIFQLKQQNAKNRSELQKSIAQNIKFRMAAQKKEEEIKQRYNQQISQLVRELKQILQAKQEMESQYNKYIQELMQEHAKQMEGRQESFSKTEDFFKQKLSNLKNHLSLNKEEKQKQYFNASECKLRLMKQIDELNYSIEKEKIDKREFQKSNEQMVKIIRNIEKELIQTKQNLEKSQIQVFKIEKDKNEIIIELKSQNKSLCDAVKNLQDKIQELERSLSKKESELTKLEYQTVSSKKQLDEKTKSFLQKNLQLQQTKTQKKQLEEQNTKLSQTLTHQKEKFQSLVQELQLSIRSLSAELSQTESHLNGLQKQNIALSSQLQSLQKQNTKIIQEMNRLQELNKKYKKDNIQFLQELEFLSLQNKSMKEDKVLKDNHLRTLQQMCEQLQKSRGKNKQAEQDKLRFLEQNERLQAAKIKDKNYEIAQIEIILKKKYETQISGLRDQNSSLKAQIQHIVREYELKLSQKQRKWQIRVQNIEKDLQNLMNADQSKNTLSHRDRPLERFVDGGLQSANHQKYISGRKQARSPYILKNKDEQSPRQNLQGRPDILTSLTRRDTIRNKYQQLNSPKQKDFPRNFQRVDPYNQESSFRKRDTKYYDDIQKKLNEFSNSRKINY